MRRARSLRENSLRSRLFLSLLGALALGTGAQAGPQGEGPVQRGHPNEKSIGIYIGRELTADGSTILAGFGHEPSSHWMEIVPRQDHPEGATTQVGVTDEADIPGQLIEIPQAEVTFKYITSNYSEYAGFPPPLTDGGLNEHGVAARDIWSPSRPELVEMSEEAAFIALVEGIGLLRYHCACEAS